jgi:hypothetical protein
LFVSLDELGVDESLVDVVGGIDLGH